MAVINTNIASINSQRQMMRSELSLGQALRRLASGLRINSAKDDAAGLAIASRMSAQVRGMNQAIRNANDGISLAQTGEGALAESSNILRRIRDISVQAANDSNSGTDRSALQQEVLQLQQELNRIASETEFNGKKLLDGTFTGQLFQIGPNANQTVSLGMNSAKTTDMGNHELASNGTSTAATQTATTAATNTIAAQTLTISGVVGTDNVSVTAGMSAKDIADTVNAVTSSTGVTAEASTTATVTVGATGTYTFNLYGANSSPVAVSAQVISTSDLSGLAEAINGTSASTGITASATGGTMTLTSAQGYDIGIENVSNGSAGTWSVTGGSGAAQTLGALATTDSTRLAGTVSFQSSEAYSVVTSAAGTLLSSASNASTLSSVASINVGSQAGAEDAISVVDGALSLVDGLRARLGAVQNRIESTISNLSTTAENVEAARSRIEDADFAKETAELTRAQVLQQAGVAMLAQANALPNLVLSLLR